MTLSKDETTEQALPRFLRVYEEARPIMNVRRDGESESDDQGMGQLMPQINTGEQALRVEPAHF